MTLLATDEELLEQRRRKQLPCWIIHSWGKWSDPKVGSATNLFAGTINCMLQDRTCTACGKFQCRVIK